MCCKRKFGPISWANLQKRSMIPWCLTRSQQIGLREPYRLAYTPNMVQESGMHSPKSGWIGSKLVARTKGSCKYTQEMSPETPVITYDQVLDGTIEVSGDTGVNHMTERTQQAPLLMLCYNVNYLGCNEIQGKCQITIPRMTVMNFPSPSNRVAY